MFSNHSADRDRKRIFVSINRKEDFFMSVIDIDKTKEQLVQEIEVLRRRVSELEVSEIELKKADLKLQDSMEKLRKAMGGIIHVMAMTVETKDPYTAGHQRRVSDLARTIGEEMNLSRHMIDAIRMAGSIHDLGKISVPTEILSKPGKINEFEFGIIKSHPKIGYDLVKGIEFPWPIAKIIYQHHERIDGSGYPEGARDGEILLEAKIIGVADVVEAMASHRPYRPSLGIEMALDEIVRNRNILYDAEVVDTCERLFNKKGYQLKDVSAKALNQSIPVKA